MVQLEDSDFAVLEDIDLNQVPALSITYTVGYINQATAVLVGHLNRFGLAADEKLRQISAGIARVETELTVLEAKLASIPGLENTVQPTQHTAADTKSETFPATNIPSAASQALATPVTPIAVVNEKASEPSPSAPSTMTVQMDPVYSKYFKMLKMGVPAQAVKIKMASEGLNPDMLDTPNAPSDSPCQVQEESRDGTDSGSNSGDSD